MQRKLFKHLRQYEHLIQHIIFVGMPRIIRIGFKLATPFLGETLRERIRILGYDQLDDWLAPSDRPVALNGTWEFDMEQYICLRANEEGVVVDESVREFNPLELASASDALRSALNHSPLVDMDDVFFQCDGEKRGSGGWGTKRWKNKHFLFMPETLVYGEGQDCLESTSITLTGSNLEHVGSELKLTTPERSYLFRFDTETEIQFEAAYQQAINSTQEVCRDVGKSSHLTMDAIRQVAAG